MKHIVSILILLTALATSSMRAVIPTSSNKCLTFDGTTQYAYGFLFSFTPTTAYTMECWFKFTATSANPQMFLGDANADYRIGIDGNRHPYYNIGDRNDQNFTGLQVFSNTWYHYAVVAYHNADTTLHADMYLNGRKIGSVNTTSKTFATWSQARAGFADTWFTAGSIDEFRIWNYARSLQQIRENMHLNVPGNTSGLVGCWRFNETSGTIAADQVPGGDDMVLVNSPTFGNSGVPIGTGTSATNIITSGGPKVFAGTDLTMNFTVFPATDTVVVNRIADYVIGTTPSTAGLTATAPWYYVIRSFGADNFENAPRTTPTNTPTSPRQTLGGGTYADLYFHVNHGAISSPDSVTPSNLKLFMRQSLSPNAWITYNSATSAANDTIKFASNGSSYPYGQFIVGTVGTSPLPIVLNTFLATASNNSVTLDWQTTTETSNYGFYVQRRNADQAEYTTISPLIPGAGTTLEPQSYTYTDQSVSDAIYYYRIKQVGADGETTYSSDIKITVNGTLGVGNSGSDATPVAYRLDQNYPNPFNPSTNISFAVPAAGPVSIQIADLTGKTVRTLSFGTLQPGEHVASWDGTTNTGTEISSGIYFYKLVSNNFSSQPRKMLLVR